MNILGISAYYHDSAAALVTNGHIVAAVQEERFTRIKHDPAFPINAIRYCVSRCGGFDQIDYLVFYDKPLLKFERLLETYLAYSPKGFKSFVTAMPVWLKEKLYLKTLLKKEFAQAFDVTEKVLPELLFTEHHQSHAASAFFPSPFQQAAVLCMDGVGEWATTSVWSGDGNQLEPLWQINFPHSLGLLYSAFTYFTGFKVNSGEYKLMGLAPYGKPIYKDRILDNLIDVKGDGTFRLNMDYFAYATGLKMTNSRFAELFDGPAREPETEISQREMDIAASIQKVTEDIVVNLSKTVKKETSAEHLCMAGGVALNCVANGVLTRNRVFDDIWIQPAAGDAGGALGAALSVWHQYEDQPRIVNTTDAMSGSYLGPNYSNDEIRQYLDSHSIPYQFFEGSKLFDVVASEIAQEKVVGWFQGRMEFGPRALGGRSILGDPRSRKMQSVMNLKIKFRESFRPFAPSVLDDRVAEYFDMREASPYMLLVADVKADQRVDNQQKSLVGLDKLKAVRSTIPAVTHVDYSARIQTVHERTNPKYYKLIKVFENQTGCGLLINTSFNVRGEPIVCTPEDAYRCFMRTDMDVLVLENCLLCKADQPVDFEDDDWKTQYTLD